jgi:hypothetical protein
MAATEAVVLERCDVFGSGAMRFAKYGQRDTAIGTLALQWLGQPKSVLTAKFHDLWMPIGPDDPAWDADGLETRNPGVRLKINAIVDAANSDDVRGNVAVGRDAQLHLLRGFFNVAVGYRAGARGLDISRQVAIGSDALADCVLGNYNTAIGGTAASRLQTGGSDGKAGAGIYIGFDVAPDLVDGIANVIIGAAAGDGWAATNRSILFGWYAGDATTPANDLLVIQNQAARTPLISGNFESKKVGFNTQPENISGFYNFVVNDSGITPNSAAASLVLEDTTSHGLSILGGDVGTIYFGDAVDNNVGGIAYDHITDRLALRAVGASRVRIGAAGYFQFVTALPTSAAGLDTGQLWNDGGTVKIV